MSRADLDLGDTHIIIGECAAQNLSRSETAYVLATAFWETARTMEPVVEAFWKNEAWRKANLRYYPWHGRGYVQLTWERNYRFAGKQLGLDLTTDPDAALKPEVAVKVLVLGMIEGWFTGKKLSDYFGEGKADYRNARRIINGTDKMDAIATIAREYERELAVMGYGGAAIPQDTVPDLEQGNVSPKTQVIMLQQDLKALGYFSGKVDGIYGRLTKHAVLKFQDDHNLVADGIVGPATREAMKNAVPVVEAVGPRDVTAADLRKRGSTIVKNGDAGITTQQITTIGVPLTKVVADGVALVESSQGAVEWAASMFERNWWVMLIICGGALSWFLYSQIIAARVRDAVTGANLSK
jgi:Putative peptidoglycan binding domain